MPSFNNFFSKTVDDLKIPNISDYKLDNTNDPPKKHSNVLKITLVLQIKSLNLSKP